MTPRRKKYAETKTAGTDAGADGRNTHEGLLRYDPARYRKNHDRPLYHRGLLPLGIRIAEIDAEFKAMLQAVATDTMDAFDEEKAGRLMNEKAELQKQLDRISETKQKRENTKSRLEEIFMILEGLNNHPMTYDDKIVRQIIECVVVESKERIKVVFVGGTEVSEPLG